MARSFDLPPVKRTSSLSDLHGLNERRLIETLQRNHVAIDFEKNLETLFGSSDKFLSELPVIKLFCQGLHSKIENDSCAFDKVKNEFSRQGIDFILIKSADSYPYESDNLDVLIKPYDLTKVVQMLKRIGYAELPQIREKHKFLFRKVGAFDELPVHIHTRVEWEGTKFIDTRDLWSRRTTVTENGGFYAPSPEDCILVTIAHLFFENHEIALHDLLKLDVCIKSHNIEWDYVFNHAHRLGWINALNLALLLANKSYALLFSRDLLPKDVLSRIVESIRPCDKLILKTAKSTRSGLAVLTIPYAVSAFYFVRKVMGDSDLALSERLNNIDFVVADIMKRKFNPVRNAPMNDETKLGLSMD